MGAHVTEIRYDKKVEKLVLAWDPDYTKVTPQEAKELEEAEKNFENGEYYSDNEIDWD